MTNSTAIGANAKVTADNQIVIGDENVTETILRGVVTAPRINCSPTIFVHTGNQRKVNHDTSLNFSPDYPPGPGKTGDILVDQYWSEIYIGGQVGCPWVLISHREHPIGS